MALSLAACGGSSEEAEPTVLKTVYDAAVTAKTAAEAEAAAAATAQTAAETAQAAAETAQAAAETAQTAAEATATAATAAKVAAEADAATAATAQAAAETAQAAAETAQAAAEADAATAATAQAAAETAQAAAETAKATADAALAAQNTAITEAGFADVDALVAAYEALLAPLTYVLTDDDATGVGPDAPAMTSGNDVLTATNLTFDAGDVIVDNSTTDADTLTINTATNITATPSVLNVEVVSINATGTLSSGTTTLSVDVAGFSGTNTFNFDSTGVGSLIAGLTLTNADSSHYVASSDFTDIDIATDTNADIELTIGADSVIDTTGAADDLTIHGGGFDVDLNSSAATEDLVIDGALDLVVDGMTALVGNATLTASNDVDVEVDAATGNFTVTAGNDVTLASADAAEGNVTVTAGRDITDIDAGAAEGDVTVVAGRDVAAVSVESAEGTVSITAQGTITLTTATAAETVILNNTGATAGDDIVVTNADSAETVTITSVGAVTATANSGLVAAVTATVTAAEDSAVTIGGVADQTLNLNAANADGDATTFTVIGDTTDVLETMTLGGSSAIIVAIEGDEITGATVTSTNTASAAIFLGDEDADVTEIANNISVVLADDFDAETITVDNDSNVNLDTEVAQTATPTFDHETNATASTSTSLTLGVYDSASTNADTTANIAGLAFTDVQALTIAMGANGIDSSADLTGADLETVTVTGSGALDLNGNTITGDATNRVTLDASAVEGIVTMALDGTSNAVATVSTGSAADAVTISGISGATGGFDLSTNAGADTITVTTAGDGATASFAINGGTGSDTLRIADDVDLSDSTVSLTSVEILDFEEDGSVSSALVSGKSFIIDTDGSTALDMTVVVDGTTVDLSSLAFATNAGEAGDNTIVDGSSNAISLTITGSSIADEITGGSSGDVISAGAGVDTIVGGDGSDVITAGEGADVITGGLGADTISLTETTAAVDQLRIDGGLTQDTVTGFSGDKLHLDLSVLDDANVVLGSTTINFVEIFDNNDVADAAGTEAAVGLQTLTAAATAADAKNFFIIDLADTTFANAAEAVDELESGGDVALTFAGNIAQDDGFFFAYENDAGGVTVAVANFAAADDNSGAGNADVTGANNLEAADLVTFSDISDVTDLTVAELFIF